MKIVQLNMVPYGSTGNIMLQIAQVAREHGHETRTYATDPFSIRGKPETFSAVGHSQWGSFSENAVHYILGSTLGRNGCYSKYGTWKLLQELDKINPDIIHLHNLHSYCINLPMLFSFIKKHNIRTIWTLHDCWAFTGQCPHFVMAGCEKWKTGCHHCTQLIIYPKSRIDNSKRMYQLKKKWFTGVSDMTLVTPSLWLAKLCKQSFLKEYPTVVINNGIDLSVFKPTESDFRERYQCENKIILLGVAFSWGKQKGLDVFMELANSLSDDYKIVLVGTNQTIDKQLPDNIISIHCTQNQHELAQIYSAADLFVNPTREEVLGLVNVEALACGTPVLSFRTGGCPEVYDETCGCAVEVNNIGALKSEIQRICRDRPYTKEACIRRAEEFNMRNKFQEYVELYEKIYSTEIS